MKKHFFLLLVSITLLNSYSFSQNIAINSSGALPDTSAMLDVSSTVKGLLVPRVTTTQQNAIPLPAKGLIVYNTSTNTVNVNVGSSASPSWSAVSFGSGGSSGGWSLSGNSSTGSSNYIGTSDGQPLIFKVNGTTAGYLGLSGSSFATSFGVSSSAGFKSTAIGGSASASSNNEATAVGYGTNAAGYRSVAIGTGASTSSSKNETIAIGPGASAASYRGITIGSGASVSSSNNDNMAVGVNASATGYQATAIGYGASATAQNSTAIGNGASVSTANYISIGNTSVTAIRGQVNFTTYSDGRFKRNIRENVHGLDFIMQLRPVTYTWDIHHFNAHARGNDYTMHNIAYNETDEAAIRAKEKITYTGFIAQEVEQAAIRSQFNFSGVLKPADNKDAYSLSYAEFVVPLVKATQELNQKISDQQKQIEELMKKVKELRKGK